MVIVHVCLTASNNNYLNSSTVLLRICRPVYLHDDYYEHETKKVFIECSKYVETRL